VGNGGENAAVGNGGENAVVGNEGENAAVGRAMLPCHAAAKGGRYAAVGRAMLPAAAAKGGRYAAVGRAMLPVAAKGMRLGGILLIETAARCSLPLHATGGRRIGLVRERANHAEKLSLPSLLRNADAVGEGLTSMALNSR
jgi:hypothetical protein